MIAAGVMEPQGIGYEDIPDTMDVHERPPPPLHPGEDRDPRLTSGLGSD